GHAIAYTTDRERGGWLRGHVRTLGDGDADVVVTPPGGHALGVGFTRDGQHLLYTDAARGMTAYRVSIASGETEEIGPGYAADCGGKILRFELSSPGCPTCPRFVLRDEGGAEREVARLDSGAFVTTYRCDR